MTDQTGGTPGGDGQRYRFESRIATGGMGEVWRATDTVLGREVAVKVLKAEYAEDPTFRSRFETEARNAAALHHPNVASVFDFGELPATASGARPAFLVMELVRGQPLSALLRGGQPMPAATAADLLAQAADALAAAHDLGIVHRDVKPANLLVTPDGRVKITDFGIARAANAAALTQTGQVIGTPQYLSPEQAEGRAATPASDIYSLGVVLYECLAGRRPFDADSPIATALAHIRQEPPPLPDDVPTALRETVRIALAKDPASRFASVRDFAAALRGGPVRAGDGTAALPLATGPDDQDADAPTRVDRGPAAGALDGAALGAAAQGGAAPGGAGPGATGAGRDPRDAAWEADGPARGPGTSSIPVEDQRRRGLPGWVPWVAAAAAVLLVVLVLTRLVGGDGGSSPGTTSPSASATRSPSRSASTTASKPAQVQVNAGDYLGRPKDKVEKDLVGLGLSWRQQRVDNPGDKVADTVSDVSPSGSVDVGSRVTVSYYGDPPATPTQTPTTTPTPSTTPSAPGSTTATPSLTPSTTAKPTAKPSKTKGAGKPKKASKTTGPPKP